LIASAHAIHITELTLVVVKIVNGLDCVQFDKYSAIHMPPNVVSKFSKMTVCAF